MAQTLFSLPLQSKRNSIIAPTDAPLAGLLGYSAQEQVHIAASVFAAAWQIRSLRCPRKLCFELDDKVLRVTSQPCRQLPRDSSSTSDRAQVCLERPLPARTKLDITDLIWAIDKLDQITPVQIYEEVHLLNQELLAVLQALDVCQKQLSTLRTGDKPSAA